MTDDLLISQILSGDQKSFRVVIDRFGRLVNHIVFRLIPNGADREDLVQEIFVRVYENLGSFRQESRLSTWIARIAYNTCHNHLQKCKVALFEDMSDGATLDDVALDCIAPDLDTSDRDMSRKLNEEIDKLPLRYGLILTMYHFCDLSYDEIGAMLKLPGGTVKSHLFRARKMLKDRLAVGYKNEMESAWATGT
ncbi:MAG: sigma-70 family RNA polymerase sigma factor [Candidatus Zixiibacteriota bacterium]